MAEGTKTPFSPGIVSRIAQGLAFVFTGNATTYFSPGVPLAPVTNEPEAKGRRFDYQMSSNSVPTPRSNEGRVDYKTLRALADNCDLVRLAIETVKDKVCAQEWAFSYRDITKTPDARVQALTDLFKSPNKEDDWATWLRMVMEDLLVIDAPAIFPRRAMNGGIYSFEPIDGATIKKLLDINGRTPMPPSPAYQQNIKGLPLTEMTADELIFKPRNKRTAKAYGFSPVEQILVIVNIALKRQIYQLQYFTDGNVPDLILSVPDNWNTDQIKIFSEYWNSITTADNRRGTRFIHAGVASIDTKQQAFGVGDEVMNNYLARVISYAFNLPPSALVPDVNRATAQTLDSSASADGMNAWRGWIEGLINFIVWKYFGISDIGFAFVDKKELDPLKKAQVDQIYFNMGVVDEDEVRQDIGRPPLTAAQKAAAAARRTAAQDPNMGHNGGPPLDGKTPGSGSGGTASDAQEAGGMGKSSLPDIHVHLGDTIVDVAPTTIKVERPGHVKAEALDYGANADA